MSSQAAYEMMRARCLLRGIDQPSYDRLSGSISDWDSWTGAWAGLGDATAPCPTSTRRRVTSVAPVSWLTRAGVAFHFAKALDIAPTDTYRDLTLRSVEAVRQGLTMVDPTYERLVVDGAGGRLYGNLRRPTGVERPPLVLLIPGTESTKEEFPFWEESFLSRGIATLSIDGPGQGETGLSLSMRHDYEVAVGPFLDALSDRSDIDHRRIGATGISLGGHYVIRAAAAEPRIRALVANCGPWGLADWWEQGRIPPLYANKYIWGLGAADEQDAIAKARAFTLDGVAENVTCRRW